MVFKLISKAEAVYRRADGAKVQHTFLVLTVLERQVFSLRTKTRYYAIHRNHKEDYCEDSRTKEVVQGDARVYNSVDCNANFSDPSGKGVVFLDTVALHFEKLRVIPYNLWKCDNCNSLTADLLEGVKEVRDNRPAGGAYEPLKVLSRRRQQEYNDHRKGFFTVLFLLSFSVTCLIYPALLGLTGLVVLAYLGFKALPYIFDFVLYMLALVIFSPALIAFYIYKTVHGVNSNEEPSEAPRSRPPRHRRGPYGRILDGRY